MRTKLLLILVNSITILSLITASCTTNRTVSNSNSSNATPEINQPDSIKSQGQIRSKIISPILAEIKLPGPSITKAPVLSDNTLLGRGFNSATGEQKAQCVEYSGKLEELATASGSTAPEVNYRMTRISNFESLRESFGMAASASFGFGLFSGDATFNYLSSGSHSKYNESVMVEVFVAKQAEQIKNLNLTSNGIAAANKGLGSFIAECGDSFIYARRNGGVLRGIITFSANSDEDQYHIGTKLSASMPLFGSGSVEFQKTLEEIKKTSNASAVIYKKGGTGFVPVTIDELLEQSKNFPDSILENPGFFQFETLGYEAISGSSQFDTLMNLGPTVKKQNDAITTLADYVNKAYQIKGDLRYYQANKKQFTWESVETFEKVWEANKKTIQEITSEADLCRIKPEENCNTPKAYEFVDYKINRKQGTEPNPTTTPLPLPKPCEDQWVKEEGGELLNESFYIKPGVPVTNIVEDLKVCLNNKPGISFGTMGVSGMFRLSQPEGRRIYRVDMPTYPYGTNLPYSCPFYSIEGGKGNKYTITIGANATETNPPGITFVAYYEKLKKCN